LAPVSQVALSARVDCNWCFRLVCEWIAIGIWGQVYPLHRYSARRTVFRVCWL